MGTTARGHRLWAMRTRTAAIVLAVTAIVVLGACSSGAGGGGTPGPSDPPNGNGPQGLDGRTFLSTQVAGQDLVPGSTIRISFRDGHISVNAGCNSMSGAYSVDGDTLRAGQLATTEMGCDPPLMAQDTWVAALLDGATIALDGDTLTLTRGDTTVTLLDREVADPDRELLGTRWVLDGIISGDAVSSVPAGVAAALTFTAGTVQVEGGCNQGGGAVQITDTTLTFGPIGLTKKACPPGVMAVEQAIVNVLGEPVAYTIEADLLTLRSGNAGLMLREAP